MLLDSQNRVVLSQITCPFCGEKEVFLKNEADQAIKTPQVSPCNCGVLLRMLLVKEGVVDLIEPWIQGSERNRKNVQIEVRKGCYIAGGQKYKVFFWRPVRFTNRVRTWITVTWRKGMLELMKK